MVPDKPEANKEVGCGSLLVVLLVLIVVVGAGTWAFKVYTDQVVNQSYDCLGPVSAMRLLVATLNSILLLLSPLTMLVGLWGVEQQKGVPPGPVAWGLQLGFLCAAIGPWLLYSHCQGWLVIPPLETFLQTLI